MTCDSHIVSAFDRDLEGLQAALARMSALVEDALIEAASALETLDAPRAEAVILGDRAIDALDDRINIDAAGVIARRAPTASDLRLVLAVMRTANGLERVGDYAKNAAKRVRALQGLSQIDGPAGTIRRMAKLVSVMIEEAIRALSRRDAVLAEQVRQRDVDIDQMYNNLFRTLLTYMQEDPTRITACMHLHFVAKNIERAGDHATGIAEQAIYLATGQLPGTDRPKLDATGA